MGFDVEGFLKGAFGNPDNPENPIPFTGVPGTLGGVSDFLKPVTGGLGDSILSGVESALKSFITDIGNLPDGDAFIENLRKLIVRLWKIIASNAKDLIDPLIDHIKEIVGAIVARLKDIVPAIIEKLDELINILIDNLGKILQAIIDQFQALISACEMPLRSLLNKLLEKVASAVPGVLHLGPVEALTAVGKLKPFLELMKTADGVEDRLFVAGDSLGKLGDMIAGQMEHNGVGLFGLLLNKPFDVLRMAWKSGNPEQDWLNLLLDIIFPRDAAREVFNALKDGRIWAWGGLPGGLPAGQMNAWLNDPDQFKSGGTPYTLRQQTLARQFRSRLVAAADAYLRRVTPADPTLAAPLSHADERAGHQLVADTLCVFTDTVAAFVLEPDCFPQIDLDIPSFEDLGVKFAALLARELRAAVRATISMVLRGFWVWRVDNEALIELIATFFSSLFSSLFEAVIRNLTWSAQVVTCYPEATLGADEFVIHRWESLETLENSGQPSDRLQYVALARFPAALSATDRANLRAALGAEGDPGRDLAPLKNLLCDFGAYLDVSYQRFRVESRFPRIDVDGSAVDADTVTITRAELDAGTNTLRVFATTDRKFDLPQPVLRAYFCCEVALLRPGATPADAYTLTLPLDLATPRCLTVTVLSNRGGRANRPVSRV